MAPAVAQPAGLAPVIRRLPAALGRVVDLAQVPVRRQLRSSAVGWGPGMMMGPGMMGWGGGAGGMGAVCDPRGAGLAEWRMERVERLITPTEAQRAALERFTNRLDRTAEIVAAACPREFPESATARLELMEKRLDSMQQAIKIVRPAFEAFYATLNDEQKARINTSGPRRWGWHGWWRGG